MCVSGRDKVRQTDTMSSIFYFFFLFNQFYWQERKKSRLNTVLKNLNTNIYYLQGSSHNSEAL